MSLTITIRQLLDLVALAVYDTSTLHAQTEPEEFDTELTIEPCPPKGLMDDAGQAVYYNLIAYFTEYPDEGAIGLGEAVGAPDQSADQAMTFFPAGSLGEPVESEGGEA